MLKVVHSPSKNQMGEWGERGEVIQAKGKHEQQLVAPNPLPHSSRSLPKSQFPPVTTPVNTLI